MTLLQITDKMKTFHTSSRRRVYVYVRASIFFFNVHTRTDTHHINIKHNCPTDSYLVRLTPSSFWNWFLGFLQTLAAVCQNIWHLILHHHPPQHLPPPLPHPHPCHSRIMKFTDDTVVVEPRSHNDEGPLPLQQPCFHWGHLKDQQVQEQHSLRCGGRYPPGAWTVCPPPLE